MMDRHLRLAVLTTNPSSPDALKTWRHWKRTFDFFLESLPTTPAPNKLATLVNCRRKTQGYCIVPLFYKDRHYTQKLSLLPDLCADVILGHDILGKHSEVCFPFDGPQNPLNILGVAAANIEAPSLFENLTEDCKPIATKSRRHSLLDERFMESEVQKLLKEEIIEPSLSPWRAQVLVTSGERHKKRLVIDYSQTINKYTLLDAYPLPRLDKMAETISRYKYYSTFDLKSA
ncbi:retrovirus-related Pol polyprotein from transposon opus [Elysia marginata]|uniref:Retrovirus-related Pol polyprotein from transposon opus n=1 Tax=Elysia marginata TaxID=1093978 RepID=A0AAV4HK21_9GAST|nr:retrovirus-related Pol polyprotein from transposon opus [Elysia marginata]